MKNKIEYFNWASELKNIENAIFIGDDLILIDKLIIPSLLDYPFRVDMVNVLFCLKGEIRAKIDLHQYSSSASGMLIILANQILELEYVSKDFEGFVIAMSSRFLVGLNLEEGFLTSISVRDHPSIALSASEMEAMQMYYSLIKNTIRATGNPNLLEVARLLTKAFFYGARYYIHKTGESQKTNKNSLIQNFSWLVNTHFKKHRGLEFYANKLYLTPKYMSSVIKQASGKSAGDWVDDRVILEAKALLKSTDMTIQQIGDELNFPSQSSFGKYFKRLVGVSPKEYRSS